MSIDYKKLRQECSGPPGPPGYVPSPTIGQREDGSWYWLDETGGDGDLVRHETRESAVEAQNRYCAWLNGEIERY